MAKEHKQVFWIKSGETFAGHGQGEEITQYFYDEKGEPVKDKEGKPYHEERLAKLKKDGYVSTEEPINIESASEMELNQLRKTVKDQTEKIVDLENDLATVPKNVTAARKEIKALKAEIVEKDIELDRLNTEIVEKDIELDKLTDPKSGK